MAKHVIHFCILKHGTATVVSDMDGGSEKQVKKLIKDYDSVYESATLKSCIDAIEDEDFQDNYLQYK